MKSEAVIVFYILDNRDKTFKKIYFTEWNDENTPDFSENKEKAYRFTNIDELYLTLEILHSASSTYVRTLNITTELF